MRYALIIPESRTRPHTKARLYKKVVRCLAEEKIADLVDVYIVTINNGIVDPQNNAEIDAGKRGTVQSRSLSAGQVGASDSAAFRGLPPARFRSGRSWLSKQEIQAMAQMQANGLRELQEEYQTILVYARGSYLASLQQAAERSKVRVMLLLTEYELSLLKRKGILWMKMGLRMKEAFGIFQRRIHAIAFEKPHQLQVPM